MVKLYWFWIVFQRTVYDNECKNSRVKCRVPVQPRPILAQNCNLFRSVGVKHIVFSFNQCTSFTFRCISVVVFISKASDNMQILQTVHDIVGYQVSDLIS